MATDPPVRTSARGPRSDSTLNAIDTSDQTCTNCDSAETKDERSQEQSRAPYVGNSNTHKFHKRSCQYAGCPNCTAEFKTREAAIQAGFKPGGCCHP